MTLAFPSVPELWMDLTFLSPHHSSVQLFTTTVKVGAPSSCKESLTIEGVSLTSMQAGQVEFMMLVFLLTLACIREDKMVTLCLTGKSRLLKKIYPLCLAILCIPFYLGL